MKIALVITIKNERKLLRNNLEFHHKLGVDLVFIFLDGTEDETEKTIDDLPYVRVASSVSLDCFQGFAELHELVINSEEHHTARQMLNMVYAKELAQKEGFDWLIAIDADELICPDISIVKLDQLKSFFTIVLNIK